MSYSRPCERCGRSRRSDGKPLEVCFAHGPDQWLCLGCYLRTPPELLPPGEPPVLGSRRELGDRSRR